MGGARSLEINSLASRGAPAAQERPATRGFQIGKAAGAAAKERGGHPQEAEHNRPPSAAREEALQKSNSEAQLLSSSKYLFVWPDGLFFFSHCEEKKTNKGSRRTFCEMDRVFQTLGKIVNFHFSVTILYLPPPAWCDLVYRVTYLLPTFEPECLWAAEKRDKKIKRKKEKKN